MDHGKFGGNEIVMYILSFKTGFPPDSGQEMDFHQNIV
jgi:hypothetical protein